jgi:transcriptional regulator with XRE-family HTH domain
VSDATPNHAVRQSFARRLRAARIANGFDSMRELAASLGIEEARYGRWERAETEPDLEMLMKLRSALSISLDVLICGRAVEKLKDVDFGR